MKEPRHKQLFVIAQNQIYPYIFVGYYKGVEFKPVYVNEELGKCLIVNTITSRIDGKEEQGRYSTEERAYDALQKLLMKDARYINRVILKQLRMKK